MFNHYPIEIQYLKKKFPTDVLSIKSVTLMFNETGISLSIFMIYVVNSLKIFSRSNHSRQANMTWTGNAKFKPYPHRATFFCSSEFFVRTVLHRTVTHNRRTQYLKEPGLFLYCMIDMSCHQKVKWKTTTLHIVHRLHKLG